MNHTATYYGDGPDEERPIPCANRDCGEWAEYIHRDQDLCMRCYDRAELDARLEADAQVRRLVFDAGLLTQIGREYGLLGQVFAVEEFGREVADFDRPTIEGSHSLWLRLQEKRAAEREARGGGSSMKNETENPMRLPWRVPDGFTTLILDCDGRDIGTLSNGRVAETCRIVNATLDPPAEPAPAPTVDIARLVAAIESEHVGQSVDDPCDNESDRAYNSALRDAARAIRAFQPASLAPQSALVTALENLLGQFDQAHTAHMVERSPSAQAAIRQAQDALRSAVPVAPAAEVAEEAS